MQFLLIHAPEDYQRDLANVAEDDDFDDTSLIRAKQDLSLFGLTWRRLVGSEGEWTNRLYLRSSDKDSTQGEAFPDLVPPGADPSTIPARQDIFTILEDEQELGWRSDFSTYNRLGEFSAGLRVVNIEADFETQLDGPWIRYVYETDDPRPPGQQYIVWLPEVIESRLSERGTSVAAYLEQVVEAGRFELRPGLRVDHDAFSDDSYLAPRLAVSYAATPALRVSLTGGLYYESPRFLVRAANPYNFGLANEEIAHVGLGLTYDIGEHWNVLVEGYYQQLDDLVVEQSRASGRALNAGEGSSHGIDPVLQRAFSKGWSADFTYSWNDSRQDDNDGRGSYVPDYAREHFASLGARWEVSDRLQIAGRWKWGSGRPGDRFIIHRDVLPPALGLTRVAQEITAVNATRLGDYQSLNLRVDYRRRVFGTDLVLFLDVINVYGADRGSPEAFNPISGELIDEDASPFPQFGLILERAW